MERKLKQLQEKVDKLERELSIVKCDVEDIKERWVSREDIAVMLEMQKDTLAHSKQSLKERHVQNNTIAEISAKLDLLVGSLNSTTLGKINNAIEFYKTLFGRISLSMLLFVILIFISIGLSSTFPDVRFYFDSHGEYIIGFEAIISFVIGILSNKLPWSNKGDR